MIDAAVKAAAQAESLDTLLQVRFLAKVDRIKLIRPGVEATARMCGLAPSVARDVVLAVDEACQNIILHAYKGRESGEIDLTLMRYGEGIVVELRDRAPTVDPREIQHRDLHDIKPGKLGSYFMSAIMDRLEYLAAPGGGNLLRMYKRKDGST